MRVEQVPEYRMNKLIGLYHVDFLTLELYLKILMLTIFWGPNRPQSPYALQIHEYVTFTLFYQ